MIQVSTHLFGSTDGYTTLAKSAHVSEADEHALSIFGFGSPKSQEDIDQLTRHPSVAGRLLPSGRFAITRLFPGKPDVAGRDTVERRSIIFSAQDWKWVVRCDLESLINDQQAFEREVFAKSLPHSVQVNDSQDLLPCAQELERRLYDIMLSTPRHNACALLADDPVNRRGLLQLLKLLPEHEACTLSWGLGLFAATPGVRIATASNSLAAGPHARWPTLSGNLAHPEKVALLGMHPDAKMTANKLNFGVATRSHKKVSMEIVVKHLHWIILGFVIVALGLIYAAYKSRAQNQIASQQPNTPMQQAIEPVQQTSDLPQHSSETSTQAQKKEEITSAPITVTATPVANPVANSATTSAATSAATPVENPAATPAATGTAPAPDADLKSKEPVNVIAKELGLWNRANSQRLSVRAPSKTTPNKEWLQFSLDQAKLLVDLQEEIKAQVKILDYKAPDFINLNSTELSPKTDQAEKACAACMLVLAQCEIIAAKLEMNTQLLEIPEMKMTAEVKETKKDLVDVFKKIKMPESMSNWITSRDQSKPPPPNEILQKWLNPKLTKLFKKTFPESTEKFPTLP